MSTIPVMTLDFDAVDDATGSLRQALASRLREVELTEDARVRIVAQAITAHELRVLRVLAALEPNQGGELTSSGLGMLSNPDQRGLDGLIAKGCIKSVAENVATGGLFYGLTPLGFALARFLKATLKAVDPKQPISTVGQGHDP